MMFMREMGIRTFHPMVINWSYLYLGRVNLTHMKKYMKTATFATNQNIPGIGTGSSTGAFQPPRKSTTQSTDTITMATYSASMKKANLMPLYSVWKPEERVPSSSGRSKGMRFISAIAAMRKTKNHTGPT